MNLARLDMIILLVVGTRCSIDDRTSKWYGYLNKKWLFAQVHSSGMLFHRNQRQSTMKPTYAEEERSCMKKIRGITPGKKGERIVWQSSIESMLSCASTTP